MQTTNETHEYRENEKDSRSKEAVERYEPKVESAEVQRKISMN